jgi:hypothetical protein
MNRPIEEIKNELGTVNIRLITLSEESQEIDARGKRMAVRRQELMTELEEAENA